MAEEETPPTAEPDRPWPVGTVDVTNCDREPIHVPGGIQPHGVLLAFDPGTLNVVYVSENLATHSRTTPDALLGRPAEEFVDGDSLTILREAAARGTSGFTEPIRTRLLVGDLAAPRMGVVGLYDDMLLLEAELDAAIPSASEAEGRLLEPAVRNLRRSVSRIESSSSMTDLYRAIAEEVRSINRFDRVMVYRFLKGGHGAVVGEAVRDDLESYLGLHYPATDIPRQARRLYTLNTLRLIADVNAAPVPIHADPSLGDRPLDLTHSAFRSVSPIHLEYLRNMGVAASMSISILRGGELWGLIACHHYSPRYVSLDLRSACELLGAAVGSFLASREIQEETSEIARRRMMLAEAAEIAAASATLRQGLVDAAEKLKGALEADGLAICIGETVAIGKTPPRKRIDAIRDAFASREEASLAIESLADVIDGAEAYAAEASGAFFVRSGSHSGDGLIFFRPEYAEVVHWAGNPEKSIDRSGDGVRLSPRKSFEAWKQTARLRSREWSSADLRIAEELSTSLAILVTRRLSESIRLQDELVKMNSDLDAFAYSVSHDLKEPLRSVHQTIFFLKNALKEGDLEEATRRTDALRRISSQMDHLVEAMLRMVRVGRADLHREPVAVAEVVQEAWEIAGGDSAHAKLTVDELPVWSVDFMVLREAFVNLLRNALKYNDRENREVHVGSVRIGEIGGSAGQDPDAVGIYVRDNGIGIAPEHRERVFEIFKRLHEKSAYGGGAGAGLAIARKIAERHGGSLWVQSTVGEGSTFFLTIGEPEDAS